MAASSSSSSRKRLFSIFSSSLCALSRQRVISSGHPRSIMFLSHAPLGGTRQEGSERKERGSMMEGRFVLKPGGGARRYELGRRFFFFVLGSRAPAMAFVAAPARTRAMLSPSPLPRLIAATANSTSSSRRRIGGQRRPMPSASRRRPAPTTTSLSANPPSKDSDPLVRAARSAASAAAAAAENLTLKEK